MQGSMKRNIFFLLSAIIIATILATSSGASKPVVGTGMGDGFGGKDAISVTVALTDGVISSVTAEGPKETEGIGSVALQRMPEAMVQGNTIQVDGISGATFSSNGILQAAEAALIAAGVNPENYKAAPKVAEVPSDKPGEAAPSGASEYEADVAIVGAGGAGMVAAIVAADAGKTVVIVEKQALVGGNSVRATGGMNAGHTSHQDENGFAEDAGVERTLAATEKWVDHEVITALANEVREQWDAWKKDPKGYFDSAELMQLDTLLGGHGINDPALVKTLTANTEGAVEWLKTIGIDLTSVGAAGGASVRRSHRPLNEEKKVLSVGAYMIPRLEAACKARKNITILTETTAKSILTDETGAAAGIEATGKNGKVTIRSKAVVLATGGFGANLTMIARLKPELAGFMTTNAPGMMGEGIVMAQELGAAVVDMKQIQIHPTVQFDSSSLITESLRGDGAILVNREGKRFIDEVLTRDVVSAAEIAQPGSFAWLIVDQGMLDESTVIKGYVSKGYTFQGDSYEALAKAIDVPAEAFVKTMTDWNSYVEGKNDAEFGRVSFSAPLNKAPFYAIKVTPGIHHTMGGLKIDAKARVLRGNGKPIPGLFAAGEVTGGVHGGNRLGGNAVADFVVFGRIAGQSAAEMTNETIDTDVAIVGAGGAGMVAAIVAADAGKSVVIVEKQPIVGGNSVRATGGMNATHTPEQDENGFTENAGVEKTLAAAEKWKDNAAITALANKVREQWDAWQKDPKGYFDSIELMQLDTLIGGHGINDPALVETLVSNAASAVEWLKTIGIDLTSVGAFGGASVKRIHRPLNEEKKVVSVGAYMVPRLEAACKAWKNITILTDTTATSILTDDAGAAVGVTARGKDGKGLTIRAKAVVLATGGFGANLKMVAQLKPELAGFMTTNAPGATGEGIAMGQSLGAAVVDMAQIQIHPTVQSDSAALITEGLRGDGAILVNSEGKRFFDETGTRDAVSAAEIAQPGSFSWLVIDQKMANASSVIKGYITRGYTKEGDTYEALAKAIDVPADVFAKTMKDWNSYVADRKDPDFGRTSFAAPLDQAPFYAIKVTAGIHHTMGGLKIDPKARVLKKDGSVIPGLFAAGEVTGGLHGGNRLGGNAVADFVIFGRIAGQSAANF